MREAISRVIFRLCGLESIKALYHHCRNECSSCSGNPHTREGTERSPDLSTQTQKLGHTHCSPDNTPCRTRPGGLLGGKWRKVSNFWAPALRNCPHSWTPVGLSLASGLPPARLSPPTALMPLGVSSIGGHWALCQSGCAGGGEPVLSRGSIRGTRQSPLLDTPVTDVSHCQVRGIQCRDAGRGGRKG